MQKSLLPHANHAGYSSNVTLTELNYSRWLHHLLIQNPQQVYFFVLFSNLCCNKTSQITKACHEKQTEMHLHGLIIIKYYFAMFLIVMLRNLTPTTKIKSAATPRSPHAEWTPKLSSNFHSTAQKTVVCWDTHFCTGCKLREQLPLKLIF